MWNPWRRLRELGHVTVHWVDEIPGDHDGLTVFATNEILLAKGMTQAERRSVLTHELVHLERGPFPRWREPCEERIVSGTAAGRLITIEALADALTWCYDAHEAAEHLHVDVPTVEARLAGLTPAETRRLNLLLDENELRIP